MAFQSGSGRVEANPWTSTATTRIRPDGAPPNPTSPAAATSTTAFETTRSSSTRLSAASGPAPPGSGIKPAPLSTGAAAAPTCRAIRVPSGTRSGASTLSGFIRIFPVRTRRTRQCKSRPPRLTTSRSLWPPRRNRPILRRRQHHRPSLPLLLHRHKTSRLRRAPLPLLRSMRVSSAVEVREFPSSRGSVGESRTRRGPVHRRDISRSMSGTSTGIPILRFCSARYIPPFFCWYFSFGIGEVWI